MDDVQQQKKRRKAAQLTAAARQVPQGLRAAWRGTLTALASPRFRRKYADYFLVMNGLVLALFVVVAVLYVPWRIALWMISFFFTTESAQLGFVEGLIEIMIQCWMFVPAVGLSFFRFASGTVFMYSEKVYFAVLSEMDPSMCKIQQSVTPVGTMTALRIYAQRMLRLMGLSILLFIVYNLPYVGFLAVPMAQLYLIVRTFGWRPALFAAGCYAVVIYSGEALSVWAVVAFKFWMSAIALTRELLEPYLSRLPDYRKHPAILRKRYYRLMFGFGLPFALLLSVPFVGPMTWGVAQAATAALVVEIERQEQKRSVRKACQPITVRPAPLS